MTLASVWKLDAGRYARHSLHRDSAVWLEKNCYIDVWIEVVHAAGLEPLAMLPCTLGIDFDGDQWTFFKPSHSDIARLYGILVQELNVWKPILDHSIFHASRGRLIFTEADAYWLPDTRGTDYRTQHTKSTIVIESIDLDAKKLGYFHNAGYFELEGEDFSHLFRLDRAQDPAFLPLFAELVKLDQMQKVSAEELAARSQTLLEAWFSRRPASNPMARFQPQFLAEIEALKATGIGSYHAYAFATIRQCGSGYELLAEYLTWLDTYQHRGFAQVGAHFAAVSNAAKTLILKAARAVNAKRSTDFLPVFAEMTASWDAGMAGLATLLRT